MDRFSFKKCLSCGKALTGRIDKRFCDAHCRAIYHNQGKSKHEQKIRETNKQLRRNRRILSTLCPQGKAVVAKEYLTEMEFQFDLFTTIVPSKAGVYYFSYEFGFRPLVEVDIQQVLIIQKTEIKNNSLFDPWRYLHK